MSGRLKVEQPAAIKKSAKVSIMRNRFTGLLPYVESCGFSFDEGGGSDTSYFSQILSVGSIPAGFEEIQRFAGFEGVTLPAAFEAVSYGAAFYFAVLAPTAGPAGAIFAADFHHCTQKLVAFFVVLERLKNRHLSEHRGILVKLLAAKVASQVFGKVGNFVRIAGTIGAIGPTVSNKVGFSGH